MNNLYKLDEIITNNLSDSLLTIIPFLSITSAIFVIVSKNPIVSVLFLIGLFLAVASYLIILGVSFIGLSYLLVYVGAVSILFLFILMLINVRVSELVTDNNNSVPLSIVTIAIFSIAFYDKVPSYSSINVLYTGSYSNMFINTNAFGVTNANNTINNSIDFAAWHGWDTALAEVSHISSIGNILYTSYPMLLLVTSIILLLSMVGAIIITIKQ